MDQHHPYSAGNFKPTYSWDPHYWPRPARSC